MTAAAALYRLTGNQSRYEAPFIDDLNNHLLIDGKTGLSTGYVWAVDDDLLLAYQRAAQAQPGAAPRVQAGWNAVGLPLGPLAAGIYTVQVQRPSGERTTRRLVVAP